MCTGASGCGVLHDIRVHVTYVRLYERSWRRIAWGSWEFDAGIYHRFYTKRTENKWLRGNPTNVVKAWGVYSKITDRGQG